MQRALLALVLLLPVVGGASPAADPPAVASPAMNVGDHLEYTVRVLGNTGASELRVAADVLGVSSTVDREGRRHAVVEIAQVWQPAPALPDGRSEASRIQYVSLHNGHVVREDRFTAPRPFGIPAAAEISVHDTTFLPGYDALWLPGPHAWTASALGRPGTCTWGPLTTTVTPPVQGRAGTFGQAPAQEWSDTVQFASVGTSPATDSGVVVAATASRAIQGLLERTWVVSSADAYTVQAEVSMRGDEPATVRMQRTAFIPGAGAAIQPAADGCGEPATEPARSPSHVPHDDSSITAMYPLQDAMATVENDPALVPFSGWLMLHPDARLAGFVAYLRANDTSPDYIGLEWFLFYASGDELMLVVTERAAPGAVPYNYWLPPAGSPDRGPFDTGDGPWLPDSLPSPITLAAAERIWRETSRDPVRSLGANRIEWGLSQQTADGYRNVDLDYIQIMHTAGSNPTGLVSQVYDWTFVNATTGELAGYQSVRIDGPVPHFTDAPTPPAIEFAATPGAGFGGTALAWAVVGGIAAVVLLAWLVKALASSWFAGYAKIHAEEKLEHPTRRSILDALQADPGIDPPALQSRLAVPWSTLIHHLRSLEQSKLVSSVTDGHHKRLFAGPRPDAAVAVLANPTTRALFDFVKTNPGASQSDAARSLGITPQAVPRHVRRLAGVNLLRAERRGKVLVLFGL